MTTHLPDWEILYDRGLPLACSQCGARWKKGQEEILGAHLDHHFRYSYSLFSFRMNQRVRGEESIQARDWYFDGNDWCVQEEGSRPVVPDESGNGSDITNGVDGVVNPDQPGGDGGSTVVAETVAETTCRVCGEEFGTLFLILTSRPVLE